MEDYVRVFLEKELTWRGGGGLGTGSRDSHRDPGVPKSEFTGGLQPRQQHPLV